MHRPHQAVEIPGYSSEEYDTALPLHHMDPSDSTRRRFAHSEKQDVWPIDDDDAKDVYGKAKAGFHTGRLGPVRRQQPPATNIVCRGCVLIRSRLLTHAQTEFIQQNSELLPPVIYTLLSCWTRFYNIGKSDIVVWDEAHFGKFGSHYLKREFYFDVHPPLGKMLVGLAGLLSGYDGTFEFKSGEKYPDSVPYITMRVMLALFGVAIVPLAWFTAKELRFTNRACHLVTIMTLCGRSFISQLSSELTPCRSGLALHQPIHLARLDASLLYLYHRVLSH